MFLIFEPIREAARERGWSFVAKEAFTLLASFFCAAAWIVVAAGFPAKAIAAIVRELCGH